MAFTDLLQESVPAKPSGSRWLPGEPVHAPTKPAGSRWLPGEPMPGTVQHSDAITAMQNAILKLDLVMHGHEEFNTFLMNRYMNGAKLDGMTAVGTNGKADGSWGARTDIGLKEVGQLATGLAKLSAEIHANSPGFDPAQIASLIPASYKEANNEIATKLAEQITALTEYYGQVADYMQKRYGDRIAENAAVVKYKGIGLTPDEQDYAAKHEDEVVAGTPVRLKDIASVAAFEEFLHVNAPPGGQVADTHSAARLILRQLGVNYV
jgi:hypothetical protein